VNHAHEKPSTGAWQFTNAIDSWTWHGYEGTKAVVEVYANAAAVRLKLNGREIGTKAIKKFKAMFHVPYATGMLTAIALDESGKEISRHSLKTAGKEIQLTVTPSKQILEANGQSLCYLPIEFTDRGGNLLPYIEQPVTVKVEGAAKLQGLGSALCKTDERYDSDTFTSYRGRLLAVLRAGTVPGKAKITITTAGVAPVTMELEVR